MTQISFNVGQILYRGTERFRIETPVDYNHVRARRLSDNVQLVVATRDFSTDPTDQEPQGYTGLEDVDEDRIRKAERRAEILRPLIAERRATKAMFTAAAAELGCNVSTAYRWARNFAASRRLSSLLPHKPDGGRGESRLSSDIDIIVKNVIDTHYLTRRQPSKRDSYEELQKRCRASGVKAPHYNTLWNRIRQLPDELVEERRKGKRVARQRRTPTLGSFPGAHSPMAVVQIDHTLLDLFLVDEIDRLPIGRPWITIAIDVFSRMVTGFYLSLDPVGTLSTGLCIYYSIIDKADWLASLGVEGTWPIRGRPGTLHMDNAKEFRGDTVFAACRELEIHRNFRPVKKPSYGGHIERLMGRLAKKMKIMPGATAKELRELPDYDPAKDAAFTLSELENWLATFIVGVYHKAVHSELGCTPEEKAHEGYFGPNGIGIPPEEKDKEFLRLTWMPLEKRTIQRYGILMDGVYYWSQALHLYFSPDRHNRDQFRVRRDPRQISPIHVWLPKEKIYLPVGYANPTRPVISLWELREATATLPESQRDEEHIFAAMARLDRQKTEAIEKTRHARNESRKVRRARRDRERRHHHVASAPKAKPSAKPSLATTLPDDDVLEPFPDRRTR